MRVAGKSEKPINKRNLSKTLCLIAVASLLGLGAQGCGIKGHLYMPKKPAEQTDGQGGSASPREEPADNDAKGGLDVKRPVMIDTDAASDEDGTFYYPVI